MTQAEDWCFYFEEEEGKPMAIFLNKGLSKVAPMEGYSTLLWLSIPYTPKKNGFPLDEELNQLECIEDVIEDFFLKNYKAIYAGRTTTNGSRDFYLYFQEKISLEEALTNLPVSIPSYKYNFSQDKDWGLFWGILMPSVEQQQSISNRELLEQMREDGDTLEEPRAVKHWTYFAAEKDRDCFEQIIQSKGFKILQKNYKSRYNLAYEIVFSRKDKVSLQEIDGYTLELFKLAVELNGVYDGWETKVLKK